MNKGIVLLSLTIIYLDLLIFPSSCISDDMKITKYPYYANEKRVATVEIGYKKIKIGMSKNEVLLLLPDPDETHQLFSNKNSKTPIGFTHWYILQRKKEKGSSFEKSEHLVRITYDINDRVARIDKW